MFKSQEFDAFFSTEELRKKGRALNSKYASAAPFPHIVIDNFLPEALTSQVADAVESAPPAMWKTQVKKTSIKSHCDDDTKMPAVIQGLLYKLNSKAFLGFLEQTTGIEGLIPDPYFDGGGLHQIGTGGFLKIHADFNRHKEMQLDRRINLLLYLNRDWDESWGGALELWDKNMQQCEASVYPHFNRLALFSTTDDSYHGHPDPITCPTDRQRNSIALYYYTNGRPAEETSEKHSTLYKERPGESYKAKDKGGSKLKKWASKLGGK